MALEPHQKESLHYYGVAHASPVPEFGQEYSRVLEEHNLTEHVVYPPALDNKFCRQCGVMVIPGLNATIRLRYKKKRYLSIRCLQCRHVTNDFSLLQEKPKETMIAPEVSGEKLTATAKAKQRAKKRKNGGLSAMLEQKKAQSQKTTGGLNLMEFMK